MFLILNHQQLDIYKTTVQLVGECYQLTKYFPNDERFGLVSQLRRASVSVHLNIAEGASRRSDIERKRYFEIARGSVIEIDAALDIIKTLGYRIHKKILTPIIHHSPLTIHNVLQ
jgi:four helix bundle protein